MNWRSTNTCCRVFEGNGVTLSALAAASETRGPGESQLETDRRLVRNRIHRLKGQLEDVRRRRAQHRESRKNKGLPTVSLIGYTNAGKSTLMNALTRADVLAEGQTVRDA